MGLGPASRLHPTQASMPLERGTAAGDLSASGVDTAQETAKTKTQ